MRSSLAWAGIGMALVFAQDAWPAWSGFHAWEYATALAVVAVLLARYVLRGAGYAGAADQRLAIALVGALVIVVAGLASGLLGPDAQILSSAPGTIAVLPELQAAAFFPVADAPAIARGDATIAVRLANGKERVVVPGRRTYLGGIVLDLAPHVAAYLEAWDARGDRLTITQPTHAAFLSPILLFAQRIAIAGEPLAADAFAAPAVHRQIKAFFVPRGTLAATTRHGINADAILFAVDDDSGRPVPAGIGFAADGQAVTLDRLRLRATLGSFPALSISAIPYQPALWIGIALFASGLAYTSAARRKDRTLPSVVPVTIDERKVPLPGEMPV